MRFIVLSADSGRVTLLAETRRKEKNGNLPTQTADGEMLSAVLLYCLFLYVFQKSRRLYRRRNVLFTIIIEYYL